MTARSLPFDVQPHALAPASREAWGTIHPHLTAREIETFLLVYDYLAAMPYADVTGGELAEWSGRDKTSTRPRLHGLQRKGWLASGAIRASRVRELRCHPYWPVVPRDAVERAQREQRGR